MSASNFFSRTLCQTINLNILPLSGSNPIVLRPASFLTSLTILLFQDSKMDIDNPNEVVEKLQNGDIDESLYSRQL